MTTSPGGAAPRSVGDRARPPLRVTQRPPPALHAGELALAAVPWTWFLLRDAHPTLDVIALGLPVLVAVLVAGSATSAVTRRRPVRLVVAASWLAFGTIAIVAPWTPAASPRAVEATRIVAANAYGRHSDVEALVADLDAQEPDVLVVSEPGRALADVLERRFDEVVFGRSARSWGDPQVLTDLPATELPLPASLRDERAVRVRITGPGGPFVVYGLHLRRPSLRPLTGLLSSVRAQAGTVEDLVRAIEAEELPVVVAGDLNLVDRTSGYRHLTGPMRDAVRTGWAWPTALRPLGLPLLARIDHILVSRGWCAVGGGSFALAGSDHRGVAASVGPCA